MGVIKKNLSKSLVFLIRKLHAVDNVITKNEDINNPNFYDDLTPVDNADEDKKYSDAILWALENENVKNIAITGPYGSGKSSVLRTFEKEHKEYNYLNISLGSFKEDIEKNVIDENRNTQIEKSVLQQIFYRVKEEAIPYSRFNRIKNDNFFSYAIKSALLALWLATVFFVYKPDNQFLRGLSAGGLFDNKVYLYISAVIIFLGFIIIIKETFRLLSHSKLNKISFTTGEIEFDEVLGASILNKHLDEILYFFEKTKFNIVVIEDLDRFDEVDIFIKLREINTLINNSDQIRRKIVFIYAIKDDVFKETNRTKFFDFIVPIIPVINASNSGDMLLRKLSSSSVNASIPSAFISDITLYVEDMRMLKNIHNEFVLYRDKLSAVSGIELPLDKLLGFIVYKNKYPDDFAKLNSNEGMVADIFNRKIDLVNRQALSLEASIGTLEAEITRINNEKNFNLTELRTVYVGAIFQKVPNLSSIVLNNTKLGFAELLNDEQFKQLRRQSQILYYMGNSGQYSINIKFSDIEEFVNPHISYDQRELLIIQKTNGHIEDLKKRIEALNEEKRDIKSFSVKGLIERFPSEKIFDEGIKDQKLLVYLIRNGYIDEMYQAFISYFYEGNITKNDMAFVLSVKNQEPLDFSHPLVKVEEVIKKLNRTDFKRDAVLNFDLLAAQLQRPKGNEYLDLMLALLSGGSKRSLEFIDSYLAGQSHAGLLVKMLCKSWSGFWKCIAIDSGFSSEKIDNYLKMIVLHADGNDLIKINIDSLLNKYISEKKDFINLTASNSKLKEIITKLKIKFVDIEKPEVNEEVFDFIYKGDFYVINTQMIERIINYYNADVLKDESLRKANYSTILESNCAKLIEYIDANINDYLQNVFLKLKDNISESEKAVIVLLNTDGIEEQIKFEIIEKEITLLTDISVINDKELWKKIVLDSKIKPTWENVLEYFTSNESLLDDALICFLNRSENYKVLSEINLKGNETTEKEDKQSICRQILLCNDLSDASYAYLIKSIPYWYNALAGLEDISNIKIGHLINQGKLQFTKENFNLLKDNFNNQYALLVERNISTFIKNIDEYELDAIGLEMLLKSKISADQKNAILDKIDASIIDGESRSTHLIYDVLLANKVPPKLNQAILVMLLKQNSVPLLSKVKLFISQVNNWDISVISSLLKSFGPPISGIFSNQRPLLENNDTYKVFANRLKEKGLVSSFKESEKTIRLYPKKT